MLLLERKGGGGMVSTFSAPLGMTAGTGGSAEVAHATSASAGEPRARIDVSRGRALIAAALLALVLGAIVDLGRASVHRSALAPHVQDARAFSRESLLSLPLSARGPVSASFGEDSAAFAVGGTAGSFQASNPAQRLRATFDRAGVLVYSDGARVALALDAIGYGDALRRLALGAPSAAGNRVSYRHSGIGEWYVNGPLGLEQSFTLSRAPTRGASGPLTIAVALSRNVHASLAAGGQSVTMSRAGRTVLRYTGLSVTDATGRSLRSSLALAAGRILIHVDADGARYPLRIDPFVQQGEKLTGKEESKEGLLGYSVALSANGDTAVVGAAYDEKQAGAAYVFTRSGESWSQQARLVATGESGEGHFGYSVALSANGNTALIGAPNDNSSIGAAWIFTRSGEKWKQAQELTGHGESGEGVFGRGVALSAEGTTAIVGGPLNGSTGGAWIFTREGEKWTQQGEALTVGGVDGLGESVALSATGNTALAGAPLANAVDGGAYVFTRSDGNWSEQSQLTGSGEAGGGEFGVSVALSGDGNTALVGAYFGSAAWVFTRSDEKWSQQEKLTTGEGGSEGFYFGKSVALAADGQAALVGGYDYEVKGAAWAFTRSGSTWSHLGGRITGEGESADGGFGFSVALSEGGYTALVGSPFGNEKLGAAWVFTNQSAPTVASEAASGVTTEAVVLHSTVNANGNGAECVFEYGTSTYYGKTVECSPKPTGEVPVAVSAALSGLSSNATYHFRVVASNLVGARDGADESFTTLATSASAETKEENKPAEAKDNELTAKAGEGTGTVTAGTYGSDIGGPALAKSTGKYIDIYHTGTSTFKQVEIKDCELGGGRSLWWDNPAATWEPILEPPAVYSEGPPACVTVTLTESTKPSVAQLIGTRFGTRFGGAPSSLEYGKCVAAKDGFYEEGKCQKQDLKKGLPKGKYEWYANPVGCFPKKNGYYSESQCLTEETKKGKPKGKYEKGSNEVSGSGGEAKLEIEGIGALTCTSSTATGELPGQKEGIETITYSGCKLETKTEKTECASKGAAAGTIATTPLETFVEDEGKAVYTEIFQDPIAIFTCNKAEYTLHGGVRGETTGDANTMSLTSETVYKQGVGEQELYVSASGAEHKTVMTATYKTTGAQEMEIDTNPPQSGG
jgi:FG-GAP repeat